VILDVHYHTIKADDDRASPLRVAICHREELTLPYGLATADIDQNAESFQELLYYSLVTGYRALPLRLSDGRLTILNEEDSAQLFGLFDVH
jgi:hypothetical protein